MAEMFHQGDVMVAEQHARRSFEVVQNHLSSLWLLLYRVRIDHDLFDPTVLIVRLYPRARSSMK